MGPDSPDTFFNGKLKISQPDLGYRFSLDAILVAAGVLPKPGEHIVDLGTGCGIIALLLAFRNPHIRLTAIEIQSDLAEYARLNVSQNNLQDRIAVLCRDMRLVTAAMLDKPADWIVCNPPYHRPHSGRINPQSQKALARHEIAINLEQLIVTASHLIKKGGRFATIYPADRTVELLLHMKSQDLEPKWMQTIHSHTGEPARLILLRGMKGARSGLKIGAPITIYNQDGTYTDELLSMMMP